MKTAVGLLLTFATLCVAKKSYEGYVVFRITPQTDLGKNFITELAESEGLGEHLDFWHKSQTLADPTDVMVPPRFTGQVRDFLHRRKMKFSVMIENVEDLIVPTIDCPWDFSNPAFYNCYHNMQQIEKWMDEFSASSGLVSKVSVSKTFEGKDVSALKISSGEGHPAVIFQGGIHAREWISPATMMNLAKKFVENYGIDDDVTQIVDFYDIFIVPVLNKDGYEFTWTDDRLWRKNRNTNNGARCIGVDLNRNWDVAFGGRDALRAKCSEIYRGESALSEPETSGMDEFARGLQESSKGVHVFIDFHSYGQYWMWPWGYDICLPSTPDAAMQKAGAMAATEALTSIYGKSYTTSASAEMYPASGATEDWAYYTLRAKYSYIVELRPDDAQVGFLLPEDEIEPTGEETFEGVKALLLYTLKNDGEAKVHESLTELPQRSCRP